MNNLFLAFNERGLVLSSAGKYSWLFRLFTKTMILKMEFYNAQWSYTISGSNGDVLEYGEYPLY